MFICAYEGVRGRAGQTFDRRTFTFESRLEDTLGTILESTAQLVVARDAYPAGSDKARALDELIAALTSVLRARGKRYLMANVPRAALEDIKRVLPGLNGPTVVDILDGGALVAVHAVVPASAIYRTIAELKALGSEGILVTRIERLMP